MQPNDTLSRANLRRLMLAVVIVCILLAGILIYQSLRFHVVSTTPSTDNFPVNSPVLFIDFNKPLAKTTLTTIWNPGVNSTYSISGKRLTINIQSVLQTNKQYTVTIKHVASQTGDTVGDITYTLTPKDIAYSELPTEIQQAIFRGQDKNPPLGRNAITFGGTDGLISQGISTYQTEALKQAIFLFGQKTKTTITTAVIDDSTINIPPYNSDTVSDYFTMLFDLTINKTLYHATLLYGDVTTMRLQLTTGNTQVYDSGDINGATLQ